MALQINRQTLEIEDLVGTKYVQALVRAEALVPGAGREAIEPLMAEASLYVSGTDLQTDRVVIEGTVSCQGVYRQGEETIVKALAAKTSLNQVIEIPGTTAGMLSRVCAEVEHVESRYENGHMIFLVTCGIKTWVMNLSPVEVIQSVSGVDGLQTVYQKLCSVKLAAEASEMVLLKEKVALPTALDARTSLMDWANADIEESVPDLGGVRIKGKVLVETLVASGVAGRPAVLVRYPMGFDQLVEIPEWLTENVFADAEIRSVRSQVEQAEEGEDAYLVCEAEVKFSLTANTEDCSDALTDIYATQGKHLEARRYGVDLCVSAQRTGVTETVRGTVLIGENAPGVGTVIATRARPVIGEWANENGRGRIDGIIEASVLYMPGGSDMAASAKSELPFSISVPVALSDDACIRMQVISAEANALMSDRLEMKIQMNIAVETRKRENYEIVQSVEEGAEIIRKPGIVIFWPEDGENAWNVGKRYGVMTDAVSEIKPGKPVILKI
ncbi:MAG: DUF3794 domain-containing protein [Clostridia bacterium]|nr:DUF3794 domain-containing protein [Clostridia bacterium]